MQFLIGSFGGAEEFFIKLTTSLSHRGIDEIIVCNDDSRLVDRVKTTGLPYCALAFRKNRDLIDRWRLHRLLREYRPHFVVAWMNRAGRRLPRGRHVNVGRLGGYYPVSSYRKCSYLIANSPGIFAHIIEQGWPRDRAVMISNFGELPPASPANRRLLGVPDESFMVLGLGRFSPWKGFDHLIAALEAVPNAILCLAGDGEERERLERLAVQRRVEDRVRFLGWRDDRASLLQAADLCVVPSSHEPLSNVILEAWSLGTPVVAAASEGPSWLINDGVTGLLARRDDATDLSEKIQRLMNDKRLANSIGSASQEEWRLRFSEAVICNQYIDFFNMIG